MKVTVCVATFLSLALGGSSTVQAEVTSFQHIVVIVQENRTPDNLFQGLCLAPYGSPSACGTAANQYNIQSYGFNKSGTKIPLYPEPLGNSYDPGHGHSAFETMCNPNKTTHYPCSQNTALSTSGCPNNCSFEYVDPNSTPSIYPYLYMAQNFGWANKMYQTNQGPSVPAHQFLFAGTSAPTAADDAAARFVDGNPSGLGCLAPLNAIVELIDPASAPGEYEWLNNPRGTICFTDDTMASLLEGKGFTWRYYTLGTGHNSNNFWTAPDWIQAICQPNSAFSECTGSDWLNDVNLNPAQVLTDAKNCNLKNMVWVTPIGQNSDHPSGVASKANTGGPSWVASIINSISGSPCLDTVNGVQVPYWQDTAIIVTWDDWGGFYDHVLPNFLSAPSAGQGDYQLGFRVPLLFVSAYTNPTIDSTNQYDFGSILRFAEQNFGITEGALGFADQRATTDLTVFYDLSQTPKQFQIPSSVGAEFFLNDKRKPDPADNDD